MYSIEGDRILLLEHYGQPRKQQNVVSLVSSVTVVMRLPISWTSSLADWTHVLAISTATGTRHTASTIMYSLTFCVRFLLPERHQWKPAVQTAAVMLRTPPVGGRSPAGGARRPRPAGRSHYVVISRDGRKLVTMVRVMLP